MIRKLLHALLYFPDRRLVAVPPRSACDVELRTDDGERLHGWWVTAPDEPLGHVLFCHGNAGNVSDRALHAALLCEAGFDVLLFDYRGYGRSTGRPSEPGTYTDARAGRAALLERPGVDPARVVYLGESLGGAVAAELALAFPPAGLVLQSAFTSVRDMARRHYPLIPPAVVPDAYPTLARIATLRCPLLVLHGENDEIVPLLHGEELFEAAPEPKALHVFGDAGHNDLVSTAGRQYADVIAAWFQGISAYRSSAATRPGGEP